MDAPSKMAAAKVNYVQTKLGIIDRLIHQHHESISDLFKRGGELECNIKKIDPSYTSKLSGEIERFKTLSASYKHLLPSEPLSKP